MARPGGAARGHPGDRASLTAPGSGDLARGCRAASVTLCRRSWSLIARGIRQYARQELGLWSVLMAVANAHSVLGMSGGQPRLGAGLGLADGLGIYWEGSPHRGDSR